uniref:Uncharacterized protein n=1 Tax=Biomphalaria glabrata TaxID=6526 RepID=A0A2C9LUS2_BIOGL
MSKLIHKNEDDKNVPTKFLYCKEYPTEGISHWNDLTILSPTAGQIITVLSDETFPLGLKGNRKPWSRVGKSEENSSIFRDLKKTLTSAGLKRDGSEARLSINEQWKAVSDKEKRKSRLEAFRLNPLSFTVSGLTYTNKCLQQATLAD